MTRGGSIYFSRLNRWVLQLVVFVSRKVIEGGSHATLAAFTGSGMLVPTHVLMAQTIVL